jgi:hypothetical protein
MRSIENLIKKLAKTIKRTRIKFDRKNPRRMQFNEKIKHYSK